MDTKPLLGCLRCISTLIQRLDLLTLWSYFLGVEANLYSLYCGMGVGVGPGWTLPPLLGFSCSKTNQNNFGSSIQSFLYQFKSFEKMQTEVDRKLFKIIVEYNRLPILKYC